MKIRVVAAVVDTRQLVLYHEDGITTNIPQGDERLKPILDKIMPIIASGGVAEVEITPHNSTVNSYAGFEEKSNGLVRFYRVAKSKMKSLLGSSEAPAADAPVSQEWARSEMANAVDDIISNAQPVTSPSFRDQDTTDEETIVAVVSNTVIPGVEKLDKQFVHASKLGTTQGMENFMKRMASIVANRRHTIKDLLRFMERADLPVADDGSIIAYKVLKSTKEKGVFVDCHTGLVKQRVGSFVCMDEKLVDPNRSNECSTGLHIARRGYLKGFGGDIMVLCKIAPEHVIAVPNYDSNKVRVRAYHILAEIPKDQHDVLRDNKPMTESSEAAKLLGAVIAGRHVSFKEIVHIGGSMGTNISIRPVDEKGQELSPELPKVEAAINLPVDPPKKAAPVKAIDLSTPEEKATNAPPVNVKDVLKAVEAAKQPTRKDTARGMWALCTVGTIIERQQAAVALLAFKKSSKVSWGLLGLGDDTGTRLADILAQDPAPGQMTPAEVAKQEAAVTQAAEEFEAITEANEPVAAVPVAPRSRLEQAQDLSFVVRDTTRSKDDRVMAALDLKAFKKKAKVSWDVLGIGANTMIIMEQLIG